MAAKVFLLQSAHNLGLEGAIGQIHHVDIVC
jgi:hypothetical protein